MTNDLWFKIILTILFLVSQIGFAWGSYRVIVLKEEPRLRNGVILGILLCLSWIGVMLM